MAVTIFAYDQFAEFFGDNGIDLDGDTFKIELYNSTHTFTATNTNRAQISANALATNFGYTNPGQDLASRTWGTTAGDQTFDGADTVWSASGGSIGPARYAVKYSDTSTVPAADLLGLDVNFGQDETAGDGTDFKITWNASGLFQVQK
ncbi:hypothetical protein LCGC14_2590400 [marine sediment metagenome]|uniref:Uncharacterized protein n=1 Tax=marine sediment metagenome TaxID=412755 RepID=A0A0F9AC54_9ZZZZ